MIDLVALGAGIGSVLRYIITLVGKRLWPKMPLATWLINISGAFLAGLVVGIHSNQLLTVFLVTGICGGFTTFSTFTMDTFILIKNSQYRVAAIYYLGSTFFGIGAICLGLWFGNLAT
ncbi:CrcB family protein [Lentilactobacillus diolivorans]|uniref:fluoride efflux transporter FluC n=1 Tax=Lentilactobacillus diolivorans TaxID=179838 RepID=UPI002469A19E|nr:CrcB family protein [Lentilactobacillus diolivorans]MDH5105532.1 CrcB family protein [Lentilactobacillus diolivorans]